MEIKKIQVNHPLLRKYIKFFWEIQTDSIKVNHKILPQRNISLRFNLSDNPQYIELKGKEKKLESVFFSGLQDQFMDARLKLTGKVNMLGICFMPDGYFPFLNIPLSACKNQWLGAQEVQFKQASNIGNMIREAHDTESRQKILENQLVLYLNNQSGVPEYFRNMFNAICNSEYPASLAEICRGFNISPRKFERMFNKYVGLSPMTFITLNRFHNTLNHLLHSEYTKLSDVAYDEGYFDQAHFIREFKRFSGDTPRDLITQNGSVLQLGKIS